VNIPFNEHIEKMLGLQKEFYLRLLEEQDKRHDGDVKAIKESVALALNSQEKAVTVAEANAEKWRQSANEWRGSMNDRERNFMPRSEAEALLKASSDKIAALAAGETFTKGRSDGANWMWGIIAGLIGLAAGVVLAVAELRH
jgi:hypothetical protein